MLSRLDSKFWGSSILTAQPPSSKEYRCFPPYLAATINYSKLCQNRHVKKYVFFIFSEEIVLNLNILLENHYVYV